MVCTWWRGKLITFNNSGVVKAKDEENNWTIQMLIWGFEPKAENYEMLSLVLHLEMFVCVLWEQAIENFLYPFLSNLWKLRFLIFQWSSFSLLYRKYTRSKVVECLIPLGRSWLWIAEAHCDKMQPTHLWLVSHVKLYLNLCIEVDWRHGIDFLLLWVY